jgi:hypothetical protein
VLLLDVGRGERRAVAVTSPSSCCWTSAASPTSPGRARSGPTRGAPPDPNDSAGVRR